MQISSSIMGTPGRGQALIEYVQRTVAEVHGIELVTEVGVPS
jgi:hypothetical protein